MWRRLSLAFAAGAVLSLALAAWAPRRARTVLVGPNVAVDATAEDRPLVRSHEAPSVLVDRDDARRVYLSEVELASGRCVFSVSTDGGATWKEGPTPRLDPWTANCAMGGGQPQNVRTELRQGPDGTLFMTFQGNDPDAGGSRSVLVARSRDRGRSWQTVVVATGPRATTPAEAEVNFEGHLAVDPDHAGTVWVMWRRAFPNVAEVGPRASLAMMAVSRDGGATFGAPTVMFGRNLGFDGPRPLVVDGRLYAFYLEAPPLTSAPAGPGAAPPLSGVRVAVSASTDGGRTWVDGEIAAAPDAGEPVPAYDGRSHAFYAVWHDNRNGSLDAWFSRSTDGLHWSTPRRLDDDPPGTRVGQHFPQVSVSPTGRVDVAWYDWRDDPFPPPAPRVDGTLDLFGNRGHMASMYLASSSDGGRTWAPNVRVNDVLIDRTLGTWAANVDLLVPPAVASSAEAAIVAWSDTRNGTAATQSQDVFTSTVVLERVRSRRVTGLQAAAVGAFVGAGAGIWGAVLLGRRLGRLTGPWRRADRGPADRGRREARAPVGL